MKHFTDFYTKSIISILCAFSIFFMSSLVQAESATEAVAQSVQISSSATSSSAVSASALNSGPIATKQSVALAEKTSTSSQLTSLVGGLVLIVLLIYALSWFAKRFTQGGFLQNQTMKVVSTMPLGTRERLMLIDVGGKQMLLGITATQINTLHVFEEPIVETKKDQPITSDFSQKLAAVLQQKNVVPSGGSSTDEASSTKSNS